MKLQLLAATTKMELICCRLCFTPASELIDIFGDAPPTFDLVDVLEMYFHDEVSSFEAWISFVFFFLISLSISNRCFWLKKKPNFSRQMRPNAVIHSSNFSDLVAV